jgi:hypothetical protein
MELCQLMNETARNELLQSLYISKAQTAYKGGDFKLCVIFMRQTELNNSIDISMLVSSVWTSSIENYLQKESLSSRAEMLQFVQSSISPLFETGSGRSIYLSSTDYLKLIHIYICCGSLIISLETVRSAMILRPLDVYLRIQEWAVLKAMNNDEAADIVIDSLSLTVTSKISFKNGNGNGNEINIEQENIDHVLCISLHCLLHLQKKGEEISFNNLLNKAYNLSENESYLTSIISHRKSVLEQQLKEYNIQQKDIAEQQKIQISTQNNNKSSTYVRTDVGYSDNLVSGWTDGDNNELLTIVSFMEIDREKQMTWFEDPSLWLAMASNLKVNICIYVCVYVYTCMCIYIHIYTYIHIYIYK